MEVAKLTSSDVTMQGDIMKKALGFLSSADLDVPPPFLACLLHRRLREITGIPDPYRVVKDEHNKTALNLLPEIRRKIAAAKDPLYAAVQFAIAANIIDLGAKNGINFLDIKSAFAKTSDEKIESEEGYKQFRRAALSARNILFLADNAGEIVFDRLLIEQLAPEKVTLVVRGKPVINDATRHDAEAAGLDEIMEIIDNGSDAPGTILNECSPEFQRRFAEADMIIAKGQGNYEALSDVARNIYFLFMIKCPVISAHSGFDVGAYVATNRFPERNTPTERDTL